MVSSYKIEVTTAFDVASPGAPSNPCYVVELSFSPNGGWPALLDFGDECSNMVSSDLFHPSPCNEYLRRTLGVTRITCQHRLLFLQAVNSLSHPPQQRRFCPSDAPLPSALTCQLT